MKKNIIIVLTFIIGGVAGYITFSTQNPSFKKLSQGEMYAKIIRERDYAISKAVLAGDYKCCISPPCSMCYMEANKWNNFTAGTCACDDLIARGEEACPQCQRGLSDIHDDDNIFCDINSDIATCDSTKN